MDVATITCPADEARAKLEEYRAGLAGREPTDEDRGIVLGYQALAKGKSLIDLPAVFRACPPDRTGTRPALAVARAHWRHVRLEREWTGACRFYAGRDRVPSYLRVAWHTRIVFPAGTLPAPVRGSGAVPDLLAVVPLIPPNLRPARALHRYSILFEAEWEPVPPTDPLLIRHLHGGLYVVLAAWNLTPLEKAVLAGRIGERT